MIIKMACVLFASVNFFIGLVLFLKPGLAIEIQRRFYAKINWRVEPISMPKEIRNTRIMGVFLIVLSVIYSAYIVVKFFCYG
ncbi:hypothetical protein EPO66_04775 [bacterium]|nr:MAG: hypothetical protein EPO66_04775 [bacterium]